MREWNVPELKVLTIEKTENGIVDSEVEFWWMLNDSSKKSETPKDDDKTNEFDELS